MRNPTAARSLGRVRVQRGKRRVTVDFAQIFWGDKRHPVQERWVYGAHGPWGCPFYQGLQGGRGLGKTYAIAYKMLFLALLNPGRLVGGQWQYCYGAVVGRTGREVVQKILPAFFEACARFKEATGVTILADRGAWNKNEQVIRLQNGAAIYVLSYGRKDMLEMLRGYTWGWALFDELERCPGIDPEEVVKTVAPCIRDPQAQHPCFGWASSPNGLRGMVKRHHDAWAAANDNYFLAAGSIHDNPFLKTSTVAAIKAGMSKRAWLQEGLGIALQPLEVIFGEYRDSRHVIDHEWDPHALNVIGVDWGTSHAYICAFQVDRRGRWVLAAEHKATDTTLPRFRRTVRRFVAMVKERSGSDIYAMACDRSPQSEREWFVRAFEDQCEGGVEYLSKKDDQRVHFGLACISSMLDPADGGEPRFFLSSALSASTDESTMGARGAFKSYCYETMKTLSGATIITNEPSKRNNADHQVDGARYPVVAFRHDPRLHGGRMLPFVDDDLDAYGEIDEAA